MQTMQTCSVLLQTCKRQRLRLKLRQHVVQHILVKLQQGRFLMETRAAC